MKIAPHGGLPDARTEPEALIKEARRRQRRRWLAVGVAGAAVLAGAAGVTASVAGHPPGRPGPGSHPRSQGAVLPAAFPAIPVYYVALNNAPSQKSPDQVVVGDTFTGARLATISPPAHRTFVGMTGAADDRTFVLGAEAFPFSSAAWPVEPRTWYLLRIAPGTGHPARLARLPIQATPSGLEVAGMALSPDGSKFAVTLEPNTTMNLGPELLRIYSVATGALLRTWTGPPSNLTWGAYLGRDNNTTLSWLADGHTLVFDYGTGVRAGVRMLDMSRQGHDLIADSQPTAWSIASGDCSRPLVTSDGKSVVCVTEGSGAFPEYSTATGNLTRTLYQASSGTYGEVLWASSSGNALIGYLNSSGAMPGPMGSVGVITQSGFRPLSFPLASGAPLPDGVAW
jgi:hypothetical protein